MLIKNINNELFDHYVATHREYLNLLSNHRQEVRGYLLNKANNFIDLHVEKLKDIQSKVDSGNHLSELHVAHLQSVIDGYLHHKQMMTHRHEGIARFANHMKRVAAGLAAIIGVSSMAHGGGNDYLSSSEEGKPASQVSVESMNPAKPVDSHITTSIASAESDAEPTRLNTYKQLDYSTPFTHFYNTITNCLTEYDYVMWLESDSKTRPNLADRPVTLADQVKHLDAKVERLDGNVKRLEAELPKITEQDKKLDAQIDEATKKLKEGERRKHTKEEEEARWEEHKKIEAMKKEKAQLKESRLQLSEELHKTKRDLTIALRSVPSKHIQMYLLLKKAATSNTPAGWSPLPNEIEGHNKRRSKEVAELDVRIENAIKNASVVIASAKATIESKDTTTEEKDKAQQTLDAQEKFLARLKKERDDKMALIVETPDILNYLIQFSQVMEQQILVSGEEAQMLQIALGDWGRLGNKESIVFRDPSVDVGSTTAKGIWEEAPFFGNNTLELKGKTGLKVPKAPTFERVLAAMRGFAHNPYGRKAEQARGSESGPAAAVE